MFKDLKENIDYNKQISGITKKQSRKQMKL